jgi:hypothetical protein
VPHSAICSIHALLINDDTHRTREYNRRLGEDRKDLVILAVTAISSDLGWKVGNASFAF